MGDFSINGDYTWRVPDLGESVNFRNFRSKFGLLKLETLLFMILGIVQLTT